MWYLIVSIPDLCNLITFVEKGLGVHAQRMLEISMVLYTGVNLKQNVWKTRREMGDLSYDHDLTN